MHHDWTLTIVGWTVLSILCAWVGFLPERWANERTKALYGIVALALACGAVGIALVSG